MSGSSVYVAASRMIGRMIAAIAEASRAVASLTSMPLDEKSGRRRFRSIDRCWQPNRKRRSAARLALDRNIAPHQLTEPFADREPEAGAPIFARSGRGGLRKFLEQLTHLLRRHANAGIGDGDGDPIAAVFLPMPRIDGNGAAFREFIGIAQEIEQGLPQPHGVRV